MKTRDSVPRLRLSGILEMRREACGRAGMGASTAGRRAGLLHRRRAPTMLTKQAGKQTTQQRTTQNGKSSRPERKQPAPLSVARAAVLRRDGRRAGKHFDAVDLDRRWKEAQVVRDLAGAWRLEYAVDHDGEETRALVHDAGDG